MIEGAFAARVGGVGAYTFINDLLYLELTAYKTLGFNAQNSLGMDPFDAPGLFGGIAPYWRVALEPHWGRNTFMVGTFGMTMDVHPWIDPLRDRERPRRFPWQIDLLTSASMPSISIKATITG